MTKRRLNTLRRGGGVPFYIHSWPPLHFPLRFLQPFVRNIRCHPSCPLSPILWPWRKSKAGWPPPDPACVVHSAYRLYTSILRWSATTCVHPSQGWIRDDGTLLHRRVHGAYNIRLCAHRRCSLCWYMHWSLYTSNLLYFAGGDYPDRSVLNNRKAPTDVSRGYSGAVNREQSPDLTPLPHPGVHRPSRPSSSRTGAPSDSSSPNRHHHR